MTAHDISLASRVGLAAALVVLIGGLFAGWLSHRASRHEADEMFDARLVQTAQTIAGLAAWTGFEMRDQDEIEDRATGLHPYQSRLMYQVWHVEHGQPRLVVRSAHTPETPLLDLAARGFRTLSRADVSWRMFAYSTGHITVLTAEHLAARDELSGRIARRNTLPFVFATPVLALLAFLATRRALTPLATLARELDARRPDQLTPLTVATRTRELAPIVHSINRLMARVNDAIARERRFTSDAAHELRTPLAGMTAQLDAALLGHDIGELRGSIQRARQGLHRLRDLVAQMLLLARLEAAPPGRTAPLDLASPVRELCAELAPLAMAKNIEFAFEAEPAEGGASARLRPEWLDILLRNLIDNALRHAPPGGQIEVHIERVADGARLSVSDTGPGVPEADLSRLGERFFRAAPELAEGSGLGLSIVRRIVELSGATLRLANRDGGGFEVSVHFPL
jgi:two-component system sensor histidine kinase QseC